MSTNGQRVKESFENRSFQGCFAPLAIFKLVDTQKIFPTTAWLWMNIQSFHVSGCQCRASNAFLGLAIGLGKRQVQEHINILIEVGALEREETIDEDGNPIRYLTAITPKGFPLPPARSTATPRAIDCQPPSAVDCYQSNTLNSNKTPDRKSGVGGDIQGVGKPLGKKIKPTPKWKSDPWWKEKAIQLETAICKVQKVNRTSDSTKWAKYLFLLREKKGLPKARIAAALDWYCRKLPVWHRDQHFLVIRSGASFYEKFTDVERHMRWNKWLDQNDDPIEPEDEDDDYDPSTDVLTNPEARAKVNGKPHRVIQASDDPAVRIKQMMEMDN